MKQEPKHADIDFSQMNIDLFFKTYFRIMEEKYDVKINYKVERRRPEDGISMQKRES